MGLPPFLFLHSLHTKCACHVAWVKGHVVVDEVPRDLLRRILTQSGKERFRLYVLGGLDLGHCLLLTFVHVALHVVMKMKEVKSISIL